MSCFGYGRRIGYLALSTLAGWFAGQIVTLPSNLLTAVRDSEGEQRLFVQSIGLGLIAWGAWTLILATAASLFVALPIVLAVRPKLLVRYRTLILALALLVAAGISVEKGRGLYDPSASTTLLRFIGAVPYGLFAVVFAVVTAWAYVTLARRRLEAQPGSGPG